MTYMAIAHMNLGNDSKALQIILRAKSMSEKSNVLFPKAFIMLTVGDIYLKSEDYFEALTLYRESNLIFDSLQVLHFVAFSNNLRASEG